ncbi:L-threonylcarbamoyladenylate synthase [Pyruvatibacter sp. HU-CL02332]|uniref:L-threonylcarbamoyladenylate synthase n=1 Tax=Pyruvatibacter sp. HU-CL02332 TaxID=3127650 RepID=UPI003106A834
MTPPATLTPTIADNDAIDRASQCLLVGGLVAFPTETVYGLGADATSDQAVARIFEAKGRPQFNPLISHVSGVEMAGQLGELSGLALKLAHAFWPGPLTLVVLRAPNCPVSLLASAGLDTIAIRMPNHPVAQALIGRVQRPLAAPSANPSGRVSPTTAQHVTEGLDGRIDMVLDGGPCTVGLESTVVSVVSDQVRLLRPGTITREQLEAVCSVVEDTNGAAIEAPGMLASHYAPNASVRLNVSAPADNEALLGFGPDLPQHDGPVANLSPTADLVEAAANLFAKLRQLDATSPHGIAVMPIPTDGIGEAINDRLKRAAAPKT